MKILVGNNRFCGHNLNKMMTFLFSVDAKEEVEWSLMLFRVLSNAFGTRKQVQRRRNKYVMMDKLVEKNICLKYDK